jgi:four helix bundle protein
VNNSFKDLKVWQKAMDLAELVYQTTEVFPKHEIYGLTSQMRRAAVSVPSNIAEGKGRSTDRDFVFFLHHSRGSLHELETQLLIARRCKYVNEKMFEAVVDLLQEVGRMLNGLISALEASGNAATSGN